MSKAHLDLFSGIGGFALAAQKAGFNTVAFCENADYPRKVLNKNFPEIPVFEDVRTLNGNDFKGVDLITGGFPCTDLSRCSKSTKTDLNGKNSGLFFELARIINEAKPRYFLIENVVHIVKYLDLIREFIPEYDIDLEIMEASEYGAMCRRKRAFILGTFGNGSARKILNQAASHRAIDESGWQGKLPMLLPWKGGCSLERLASCIVENPQINATRIRANDGFSRKLDGHRYLALGNAIVPVVAYQILRYCHV